MIAARFPELEGRVALVTGANHGIGAAVARSLGGQGARVLLTYLRLDDPLDPGTPERYSQARAADADAVVEQILTLGGNAFAVEADLLDTATPARLYEAAEARFGPVDILINNASSWLADTFKPSTTDRLGRRMETVSATSFERQFGVDARAAALLIAEFARRHVARQATWGRIVGFTSGGPNGFPEEVSYGAAKAALDSYTKSAGLELAPYGVTANVVHPPVTDTGWVTGEVEAFVAESAEHLHVATPEQVADFVLLLLSDASALLTSNTLYLR